MANVAPVTGSVLRSANGRKSEGKALEAIAQGDVLYEDPATKKLGLAQCDDTAIKATVKGVALNAAAAEQPVDYCTVDPDGLTLGAATLAQGTVLVLSPTPGKMRPVADLEASDRVVTLGVASSATKLILSIHNSGASVPAA